MGWRSLTEMTWEEVRDLDAARVAAILPIGAIEAHGPHLPLSTDIIIAEAMARAGATQLGDRGIDAVVLPSLPYAASPFAQAFPGTLSVSGTSVSALVADIGRALAAHGFGLLALANAHLDPEHLASLRAAARVVEREGAIRVAFPDLTRRGTAARLTEEFRSGACHAGRFEGSIVQHERPGLVRTRIAKTLPPNPSSLSVAIRAGKTSFEEAGGPRAYFGSPSEATAREGEETVAILGALLAEAVAALVAEDLPTDDRTARGEEGR